MIERVTCANVNCYQRLVVSTWFVDRKLNIRRRVATIFDTGAETVLLSAVALGIDPSREEEIARGAAAEATHYGIE